MNLKIKVLVTENNIQKLWGYEKLENNLWSYKYFDNDVWFKGIMPINESLKVDRHIFTGLLDINNNEIYVGDNIKTKYDNFEADGFYEYEWGYLVVKFTGSKFVLQYGDEIYDLDKKTIKDFECVLIKD